MSILKHKIKACKLAKQKKQAFPKEVSTTAETSPENTIKIESDVYSLNSNSDQPKKRQRLQGDSFTPKCYLKAKNIVTNFGKAIATFAMSDLAQPYLIKEIQTKYKGLISPTDFLEFVKNSKGSISSIDSLRNMVLVEETDSLMTIVCKKCFQTIAEIFIKCFSVNWIIHGRVTYKLEHLKFRNKMLRRIKNPEIFTYLKGYNDQPTEKKRRSRKSQ